MRFIESYQFLQTLLQIHDEVPKIYVIVFGAGNILLQGLNFFWSVSSTHFHFQGLMAG